MRTTDRAHKPVNDRAISAQSLQSLRNYRRFRYTRPLPCQPRPA